MSLRMTILSLIAAQPRSGYDITKELETTMFYVWHAKPTQIYPELRKMADEDLIRVADEGPRGRRSYAITEQGLATLRDWLRETAPDHSQRNETVLRAFNLWLVDRDEAIAFLREEEAFHRARLRELRAMRERLPASTPLERAVHLGLEAGVHRLEAMVSWARWAVHEVEQWPDPEESDI